MPPAMIKAFQDDYGVQVLHAALGKVAEAHPVVLALAHGHGDGAGHH